MGPTTLSPLSPIKRFQSNPPRVHDGGGGNLARQERGARSAGGTRAGHAVVVRPLRRLPASTCGRTRWGEDGGVAVRRSRRRVGGGGGVARWRSSARAHWQRSERRRWADGMERARLSGAMGRPAAARGGARRRRGGSTAVARPASPLAHRPRRLRVAAPSHPEVAAIRRHLARSAFHELPRRRFPPSARRCVTASEVEGMNKGDVWGIRVEEG